MSTINIQTDPEIKNVLPQMRLGLLQASVKVEKSNDALLKVLDQCIDTEARADFPAIREIETINQARSGYKVLGKDANRYRPSADSLHRRITKERGLYTINNAVEIINIISIKSGFSIGGYDLNKIQGNISFRKGKADETYFGLGRGKLNIENMPLLSDDVSAFGCPTSDSERTSITENCKEMLMVFFDFGADESLQHFLDRSSSLLEEFAGGRNISIEIRNV